MQPETYQYRARSPKKSVLITDVVTRTQKKERRKTASDKSTTIIAAICPFFLLNSLCAW